MRVIDRIEKQVELLGPAFGLQGEFVCARPFGCGHIHDTFQSVYRQGGGTRRYVHQRINTKVFPDPRSLMENIVRVTEHQQRKLLDRGVPDAGRRALQVIFTRQGSPLFQDEEGRYWRTYHNVDDADSCQIVQTAEQAHEVGRAFGRFLEQLRDLPGPPLHETIPNFHDLKLRLDAFDEAVRKDALGRAAESLREIEFVQNSRGLSEVLPPLIASGAVPIRITHNDTKANNVLLDLKTGEGVCVVDLDTVMSGVSMYDFGDMARTATCRASEDERNLSLVEVDLDLFEALARGFWRKAGFFLTDQERRLLPFSAKLMPLTIGVRFLTDHLSGDVYFKVNRPDQNLDRCRVQFRLIDSIARNEERLHRIIEDL